MTTLYVGNLPFSATEAEVRGLFEQHGKVDSVKIVNDRESSRPRGFCFVDMPAEDAQRAIAGLNDYAMSGPGSCGSTRPVSVPPAPRAAARAAAASAGRFPGNSSS
jgi:RNA recognition motif-containing protein